MKKLLALVLILIPFTTHAAQVPMTRIGTTISPLFTNDTLQIPSVGGSGTRCVQTDNSGNFSKAAAACGSGSGGGSGSSPLATTTSTVANHLIIYPLNTTDILTIGNTATTSAPWWYDPSVFIGFLKGLFGIGTTSPANTIAVNGGAYVAGSIITTNLNATGTVGVGPLAPTERLTVSGAGGTRILLKDTSAFAALAIDGAGDTASLDYRHSGVSKWGSGLNGSSDSYNIWDASLSNQNIITIPLGGGLVGIGTSTPTQTLSVQGGGLFSGNLVSANLTASGTVSFANALTVGNGGTGAKTLTGCLTGNGTSAITGSGTCNTSNATVSSIATNAGLTGGTITGAGTIGLDLTKEVSNTLQIWNGTQLQATGTPALTAGYFIATTTTATSTFAGGFQAAYVNLTGGTSATNTAASGFNLTAGCFAINNVCITGGGGGGGSVTAVTATWPVISSGGTAPNITWGGLSTTTNLTPGQLPYVTGVNTFGQVATTSIGCSGNISCTGFTALGSASTIAFTGTLPIANGGTNSNAAIGASSTAVLSDGTKYVYSKLSVANFTTPNVSQFTNDANYITTATANVISVANSDGTLTISPTTGNVVSSIALGHANFWTGRQNFTSASSTSFSSLDGLFVGRTSTTTLSGDGATSTFAGPLNVGIATATIKPSCIEMYYHTGANSFATSSLYFNTAGVLTSESGRCKTDGTSTTTLKIGGGIND